MAATLKALVSFTPKETFRLGPSAWIVRDSTHGRVASASLTWVGQEAQVIPGTLRVTDAVTGFSGRSG
jgi:hypothetical protein